MWNRGSMEASAEKAYRPDTLDEQLHVRGTAVAPTMEPNISVDKRMSEIDALDKMLQDRHMKREQLLQLLCEAKAAYDQACLAVQRAVIVRDARAMDVQHLIEQLSPFMSGINEDPTIHPTTSQMKGA